MIFGPDRQQLLRGAVPDVTGRLLRVVPDRLHLPVGQPSDAAGGAAWIGDEGNAAGSSWPAALLSELPTEHETTPPLHSRSWLAVIASILHGPRRREGAREAGMVSD